MPAKTRDIPSGDWQPWYDRHHSALVLFARQLLASQEEAADAVQDGFLRFWRSTQKKQSPGYLFACIRSAAIDLRRARNSRIHRERTVAEATPALTGPPELEDRRTLLESALAQLSEDQREVLVLKIWSELTFAQIAEVLGITLNTAASRYRYAIAKLKVLLPAEVNHE